MIKISERNIHYKIARFFWYWSFFRDNSYERSKNLCNHFWWVVSSWLMPIISLIVGTISAVVGMYLILGGMLAHSIYGIGYYEFVGNEKDISEFGAAFLGYLGIMLQLIIWRLCWMAWKESRDGSSHIVPEIIREGFRGIKENYCPLLKWDN